jgi:multidrug efflux pump subunit AcrA (membrane-fusion protein)
MAAAQIEIASAVSKPLETGIRVSARLSLAQQKSAHVTPRVPGRVEAIRVKLGDKVKKGSALAIFESPELGRARADYQAAVTRSRVARATYERERELVKKGISAERVLREAEAALAAANAEVDAADARLHAFGLSEADHLGHADGVPVPGTPSADASKSRSRRQPPPICRARRALVRSNRYPLAIPGSPHRTWSAPKHG